MVRALCALLSIVLGVAMLVVVAQLVRPVHATADTAPPAGTPSTVSADGLPTVQINGVVWSQVTVGNTVYVTGSFTSARKAGSPAGTNEVPRANLLAYDITTGALITTFNHSLNAQGMVVTVSADQSTIYVGGDFTSVDGKAHARIAAFSVSTGALINTFTASANDRVRTITANPSAVYFGGKFTVVNGATRTRLAAVSPTTGALLSWAPSAAGGEVATMVLAPSGSKVIAGGQFTTVNGSSAYGLAAIDPISGALVSWAAGAQVRDAGNNAGIYSLKTDGSQVFGTGFVFGAGGNLEGTFAADPDTGAINWIEDCHGDTYDSFVLGQAVYVVSHSHFCGNIGGFPQTPQPWKIYRATAFSSFPTQTVAHNTLGGYTDWFGFPAPTQLDWYPTLTTGTFTGQNQAAWSISGNSSYLTLGGEFPSVNGAAQQGLVRFAVSSLAPNLAGPRPSDGLTPTVDSSAAGSVRLSFQTTYDQDNGPLKYQIVRDGRTATPIYTTTVDSRFWNLPTVRYLDTGLAPGSTHTYRVYVFDPFGNSMSGHTVTVTVSNQPASPYVEDVLTDGATDYWRLNESSGTTFADGAGSNNLTSTGGITRGVTGAISDGDAAARFDGSSGTAGTATAAQAPNTFTIETWFQTTTNRGGKLVGYGDQQTGNSSNYDRHIYMDNAGHIIFGVYPGAVKTISSAGTYNDGTWHQTVATLSPAGMVLYVDGLQVANDPTVTTGQAYSGYWRVGGDNLGSWTSQPSSRFFGGGLDDVSIYSAALTGAQVRQHFIDSGRTLPIAPAPTDSYGKAVYGDAPDMYWRLDETSGTTASDTSPNLVSGTDSGSVALHAPSTVTGSDGSGVGFNGAGTIGSTVRSTSPSGFTEEAWFNTTTTQGGKIIGFGSSPSGNSASADRHVYMLNTGQLSFGTYSGGQHIATSPLSYNDGAWHYVAAQQGPDGMALYVDGLRVATDPQTTADSYSGYWRVGGDTGWAGEDNSYFTGTIDEVAVYQRTLTPAQILAHYKASPAEVNLAPIADATSSCTGLTCSFGGSGSSDPDGSVASYAWDFGDGATDTTASPSHTYTDAGEYTATLTVTDNEGLSDTSTTTVDVTVPLNQPPTASFTSSCTDLTCTFDASGSTDSDGTIATYDWTFSDGGTASGSSATHTFAVAGDYPVSVTVADDLGATNTATNVVTGQPAANQPATPFAADAFNRTATNGFGAADTGGNWTGSVPAQMSVSNGTASIVLPSATSQVTANLLGATSTDADLRTSFTTDKVSGGNGAYAYVVGRRVSFNNEYRARIRFVGSKIAVELTRLTGSSTEVALTSELVLPGVVYTAGVQMNVDYQVVGTNPTALRFKIWPSTVAEPSTWTLTATDSTPALQAKGAVGITAYLAGTATGAPITVRAGSFTARQSFAPPTAAFAVSGASPSYSVDASTSTDPSGTISQYDWSWGDGTVTSGVSSSHDFAAPGTYRITLTVTDPSGWTSVTTQTVTV